VYHTQHFVTTYGNLDAGAQQIRLYLPRHPAFTLQADDGEVIPRGKQRPGGLWRQLERRFEQELYIAYNTSERHQGPVPAHGHLVNELVYENSHRPHERHHFFGRDRLAVPAIEASIEYPSASHIVETKTWREQIALMHIEAWFDITISRRGELTLGRRSGGRGYHAQCLKARGGLRRRFRLTGGDDQGFQHAVQG
jgi:hypothetical protein